MEELLETYRQHLIAQGRAKSTVLNEVVTVRKFLKRVGATQVERITEAMARSYFDTIKNKQSRSIAAGIVRRFFKFTAARLPVVVTARGAQPSRAPAQSKENAALRRRWNLDKLLQQKKASDDLIAKLARRVIDHYLFFQAMLKDGDVDLDAVARFADECRELIESNLPLFMSMSAQGQNIHSRIDERVQQ